MRTITPFLGCAICTSTRSEKESLGETGRKNKNGFEKIEIFGSTNLKRDLVFSAFLTQKNKFSSV